MRTERGATLPTELVERIRNAISERDLDALTSCFASDYLNEAPVHPSRGFRGRTQVRKNWERIIGGVPDITATVLRSVNDGGTAWSEWEMSGTRVDGSAFQMCGVAIFGVADGEAQWCRFYLDPVDEASTDIDRATASVVSGQPAQREGTNPA